MLLVIIIILIILSRFGSVARMYEYRMVRRVLMMKVSGGRIRGKPRSGWLNGVKVTFGSRGVTVEAVLQWTGRIGEHLCKYRFLSETQQVLFGS